MIRGFGSDDRRFLLDLERIETRVRKAQMDISSGKRIHKPSDAAEELTRISGAQGELARIDQVIENLGSVGDQVNAGESILRNATRIMDSVLQAATRGANSVTPALIRSQLAAEVREWHSQVVSVANSSYNGTYLFGGDEERTPPYSLDWAQPSGVVRAHDQPNTKQVYDSAGDLFPVSRRAQDIFDLRLPDGSPAAANIFSSLHDLSTALQAGDLAAIDAAHVRVRSASEHLNSELAFYGRTQKRVIASQADSRSEKLRLTTMVADLTDTDIPAAASELANGSTEFQAALSARARVPRTSLFDYLA